MARILLIAYSTYVCDARVKRHAEALVRRGDTVDVICLAPGEEVQDNGVNLVMIQMPRYRGALRRAYLSSYLSFFFHASLAAAKMASRQRYDLVIVCTMPDAAIICAFVPRLLGSKVMLDVHDTMPELYRDKFGGRRGRLGARLLILQERVSASLAHHVLAVHELHAARLEQSGIPRSKITVVLNSPDPRLFRPLPRHRAEAEFFTIVCHGTLSQRLGLDTALEAVSQLRNRLSRLRLRIIGTGDHKEKAQALSARLGLRSQVSFEERIPLEQLCSALAGASAGLVPNLPTSATHLMLPVKLLEYAVCGIPIITTRLRTIEHYFPADAVRFFEPGDAASLARAIETLCLDQHLCNQLASRAREVAAPLAWAIQRKKFSNAIDSLLMPRALGIAPRGDESAPNSCSGF